MPFVKEFDEEKSLEQRKVISDLTGVENPCNFLVLAVDHNDDHSPVIVSSMDVEDIGRVLVTVGMMALIESGHDPDDVSPVTVQRGKGNA